MGSALPSLTRKREERRSQRSVIRATLFAARFSEPTDGAHGHDERENASSDPLRMKSFEAGHDEFLPGTVRSETV